MGRSTPSGPVAGAYDSWCYGWGTFTPGAVATNILVECPYNCRVMEVSMGTSSSAGGASRPTVQITHGGTGTFSGVVTLVSGGTVSVTPTTSPFLGPLQRNWLKGEDISININTVASEVVIGLMIMITVFTKGHVVTLKAND